MKQTPFLTAASIALLALSCTTEERVALPTGYTPVKNQPVLVNTADAFTFTVDAVGFSLSETQGLFFAGDSLVATLIVSNYGGGAGQITVTAADSSLFYQGQLTTNRTSVNTSLPRTLPTSVSVVLNQYTGQVTFALAKKK